MNDDTEIVISSLKTIRDFLRWAVTEFTRGKIYYGHGTDNAWDEALFIVLHALHLSYEEAKHCLDARLLPNEKTALTNLLKRRVNERIPAAYLINTAYFAGLPFYVDERVLIPRSPLAELIENQCSPWLDQTNVTRILDLCTGSACIAIATAFAFPEAEVDAADISTDALDVAKKNIEKHALAERVHSIQSDLFSNLDQQRYDLILSNPPYVDVNDLKTMPEEFHYEPRLGLAAGEDGLDIVAKILEQAKQHLTDNGVLIVEVGNSQQALTQRYPEVPFLWLDFSQGGEGVFLLTAEQVRQYFK